MVLASGQTNENIASQRTSVICVQNNYLTEFKTFGRPLLCRTGFRGSFWRGLENPVQIWRGSENLVQIPRGSEICGPLTPVNRLLTPENGRPGDARVLFLSMLNSGMQAYNVFGLL